MVEVLCDGLEDERPCGSRVSHLILLALLDLIALGQYLQDHLIVLLHLIVVQASTGRPIVKNPVMVWGSARASVGRRVLAVLPVTKTHNRETLKTIQFAIGLRWHLFRRK
jgi:hypothetical protein